MKAAREDDLDVASMDDEAVFGPVFHRLTFGQAIEQKLLADYRVVIVGIDNARYRRYAERGRLVTLQGGGNTDGCPDARRASRPGKDDAHGMTCSA